MKSNIHPTWHHDAKVICSCGEEFLTGSSNESITVDICSKCHPFFTGEMRFVDIQGRVDKFKSRQAKAGQNAKSKKKSQPADDQAQVTTSTPKSLKDLLEEEKTRLESEAQAQAA